MKKDEAREATEKELSEIETLKRIKASVQEEVSKLQITLSNLQAQQHSAEIKESFDSRTADGERMNEYAAKERQIEIKRIEAEKRIDIAETCERSLNSREQEVEKREQKLSNLEVLIADLNKQRSNFEVYKTSINDQLEAAKVTIIETESIFEKIHSERQVLAGRERVVQEKERFWNDCIGKLEADKKVFELEKENFLGLKANAEKELSNV